MGPSRRHLILAGISISGLVLIVAWLIVRSGLEDDFVIESDIQTDSHLTTARTDSSGTTPLTLKDGIPDGYGVNKRPDGSVYVGNFQDGQSHGTGKLTYPGGASYAGEFEDGMPHGKGICTYSSGKSEDCEFLLGQRQ